MNLLTTQLIIKTVISFLLLKIVKIATMVASYRRVKTVWTATIFMTQNVAMGRSTVAIATTHFSQKNVLALPIFFLDSTCRDVQIAFSLPIFAIKNTA